MANYSQYPVSVDGVRLDTLGWGIETAKWRVPSTRQADTLVPGQHGVIPGLDEDYDESGYTLSLLVRGTDADGIVQADSVAALRENLDALLHLFSVRHRLLDLREVYKADGTYRQAMARVQDAIEPVVEPGRVARFTVSFSIPGVFWQDGANAPDETLVIGTGVGAAEVTGLAGASAPITDGRYLVTGPCGAPKIIDDTSGASVTLSGVNLAAGDAWLLDTGTWVSRYGAGLTLDSADTAGTDGMPATAPSSAYRLLALAPVLDAGTRKVKVRLNGSGRDATTSLKVRARRKYL